MTDHFEPMAMEKPEVPPNEEEHENEHAIYICYVLLLTIMIIYVTCGTWMEKRNCGFGHETGVVILIGIAVGAILDAAGDKIATGFSPVVLFDFGLPFILYAAGYNMRRRRFFDDINNITMFGILSTVLCFIVLSVTTIAAFNWGWIKKFAKGEDDW